MKFKYIILFIFLALGMTSCDKNDFENKFDELPDARMQSTIKEYKKILTDSEFGWKFTCSVNGEFEYVLYNVAHFNEDNTLSLKSNTLEDPAVSEYKIMSEADMELVFNTYNDNFTPLSYPGETAPDGMGGDIEYNFVSISEDKTEIILEGKVYKGKLKLQKADRDLSDFAPVQKFVNLLGEQRTKRHMNLAITSGLGASEENPVVLGMDLSSMASACDYNYNYKGEFYSGRKMLYFDHDGMGLSTPITVEESEIQYFTYNEEKKRYELANSDLEGYLYCTDLPMYYVPGVYDEFMNHYSLKLRSSFGQAWDKYIAMKKANPVIKSMVVVTDYKQRIPLFDEDGNPVLDEVYNHDYEFGKHLGEGLLFSFERYNQFYFYFVPLEMVKLQEDRIKMKRLTGEFCTKDNEDPSVGEAIKNNKEFNELVDYLCNDGGWYIKRTVEYGLIDWDFISQDNPKDFFITRLE
ncbi:DUF4302 domain-containing protein [Marinifilum flexuosum]|uniref:Uncharacterized protein DUF4302 n=1 Tax=Marinifilum flexuosum TaxID=1117708 RepID=A0A419X3F7_9BACT|nr:DUF4302 domain-containing protein [Marinifilum flexuosum]RKE02248.1 uncharacterized protein DUF4302 [Marinifilum flexuosum]